MTIGYKIYFNFGHWAYNEILYTGNSAFWTTRIHLTENYFQNVLSPGEYVKWPVQNEILAYAGKEVLNKNIGIVNLGAARKRKSHSVDGEAHPIPFCCPYIIRECYYVTISSS